MKNAEDVTFGGSGLERRAEVRADPAALDACLADPGARVLPVWRGKPLFRAPGRLPGWLAMGHPALASGTTTVYLGDDDEGPLFATDTRQSTAKVVEKRVHQRARR